MRNRMTFGRIGLLLLPALLFAQDLHTRAELLSEVEWVQPGQPFTVAIQLEMDEGWHTYWRNPGDSGLPTEVQWELPPGFQAGELQWPLPSVIEGEGSASYVYEDEVWLLCTIQAPEKPALGSEALLQVRVDWLECLDGCIPGFAELSLTLPVAERRAPLKKQHRKAFRQTRKQLPRIPGDWQLRALSRGDDYVLHPGTDTPSVIGFLPAEGGILDHNATQKQIRKDGVRELLLKASPYSDGRVEWLEGLLLCKRKRIWGSQRIGYWIELPVEADPGK